MTADYYAVLGVPPGAKPREIKAAYYRLALINHPDTHPGNKECEDKFKNITMAKSVLTDDKRRAAYDAERKMLVRPCLKCSGEGVVMKQKGFTSRIAVPCSLCGGSGKRKPR